MCGSVIEPLSGVYEASVSLPEPGMGEHGNPEQSQPPEAAWESALSFLMVFNWVKASLNPETEKVSKRSIKSDMQMVTELGRGFTCYREVELSVKFKTLGKLVGLSAETPEGPHFRDEEQAVVQRAVFIMCKGNNDIELP